MPDAPTIPTQPQGNPDAPTTQTDPTAQAGTETHPTQQTDAQQPPERKWSDADLKRAIDINLARDREDREKKAEQERLKAEAQWQTLAERHEATTKEQAATITQLEERLAERDKLLTSHLKSEVKGWPEKYQKAALDGVEDGDPLALAAAIKRIRPLVEDAPAAAGNGSGTTQPRPPAGAGNPPNPPPARKAAAADQERADYEAQRSYARSTF